jgi:ribosomal protein S18 acetylase RimI-like enzyme
MRYSLNQGKDYLVYRYGHNNTVEIDDIAVMSERRKGYGTQLVDRLKKKNKNIYALMRASNDKAKLFYEKNGFKGTLIKRFYQDEDAILMLWSAQ